MKCQSCANPATVHLTTIEDGQKKELHLCQACAESHQFLQQQELNLPAILQSLIGQHVGPLADELARLACPACGIRYMEFRAAGRLGCPHDYTVFRATTAGARAGAQTAPRPVTPRYDAVTGRRIAARRGVWRPPCTW